MTALRENDEFEWDVFVSYSWNSPDHSVAELLYESLRDEGLKVWKDNHVAQAGRKIMANIIHGLEKSRCVVALITPNYINSPWCNGEAFMSQASGSLLPVTYSIAPKDMPLDIPATLAIPFKNEISDLPKIVTHVKNFASKRVSRSGLLERPFPVREDSVAHFLGTVASWPPNGSNSHRAAGRIRKALATIKLIPELKQMVIDYNHPSTLFGSLQTIQAYLEANPSTPEQWKALAHLAQPFAPTLAAYALESAGAIDLEYTEVLGVSYGQLKAAYSVSDQQRSVATQYVRDIKSALTKARAKTRPKPCPGNEMIDFKIELAGRVNPPLRPAELPNYPFSHIEWASWICTAMLAGIAVVERCFAFLR